MNTATNGKVCTGCGETKDKAAFSKKAASRDGLCSSCKQCVAEHTAEYQSRPTVKERRKAYEADPQNRERKKAYDAEYRTDPQNKERKRAWRAEYMADPQNKERRKAYIAEYMTDPHNKERTKAYLAEYKADPLNKERAKAWAAEYQNSPEGRAKRYANEAKRRATKLQASGLYIDFDHAIYQELVGHCKLMERITGYKWHIDHRVPLQHKDASGLHCAANWAVVPASWNIAKSNRSMAEYDCPVPVCHTVYNVKESSCGY